MRNRNNDKVQKTHTKHVRLHRFISIMMIVILVCASTSVSFAYFTGKLVSNGNIIASASYSIDVTENTSNSENTGTSAVTHEFTLEAKGTASTGYCEIVIGDDVYYTQQIEPGKTITLTIVTKAGDVVEFNPSWGTSEMKLNGEIDSLVKDKDKVLNYVEPLPLEGKTISVIGDSISSYTGWSDKNAASHMNSTMIGEAYYGPVGSDSICETLSIDDTWWMQAAKQTGADILVNNSSNMSGIFYDRDNTDLNQLLAYKERAVNLHDDTGDNAGTDPDIIAVYIGSNEAGATSTDKYGSLEAVNFDTLIIDNSDGTYTYAEPSTVAEAYCIMLHKMQNRYPDAEIYIFNILPNSGAGAGFAPNSTALLNAMQTRLSNVYKLNSIIEDVAGYFEVEVVNNFEGFNFDVDGDAMVTAEELIEFQSYFYEGPHPNAKGFDVITESFLDVLLN